MRLRRNGDLSKTISDMAKGILSDRYRIERLADYNGEVSRGLVHTPEWRTLMAIEQDWFNRREWER